MIALVDDLAVRWRLWRLGWLRRHLAYQLTLNPTDRWLARRAQAADLIYRRAELTYRSQRTP